MEINQMKKRTVSSLAMSLTIKRIICRSTSRIIRSWPIEVTSKIWSLKSWIVHYHIRRRTRMSRTNWSYTWWDRFKSIKRRFNSLNTTIPWSHSTTRTAVPRRKWTGKIRNSWQVAPITRWRRVSHKLSFRQPWKRISRMRKWLLKMIWWYSACWQLQLP